MLNIGSLGSLVVKVETDLTNLNRGLKEANVRVQKTTGEITRMAKNLLNHYK